MDRFVGMTENEIAQIVHHTYQKIQKTIGPGLLEKAYQLILAYELRQTGLDVQTEVNLPIKYESLVVEQAYRLDMLVEGKVIIEIKAVEKLSPIYRSQLLTYLKMSGKKLGLLINFGDTNYADNFKRVLCCTSPDELDKEC